VHAGLEKRLLPLFAGRILPFDQSCTKAYAEAITKVEKGGSEILPVDGYIAAIAAVHGLIVAARETVAFDAAGVDTINPWRIHHAPAATDRPRRAKQKTSNGNAANPGFEADHSKAAAKLRGNMEPSHYKPVALGLTFLTYIPDAFEARHAELLAEDLQAAED